MDAKNRKPSWAERYYLQWGMYPIAGASSEDPTGTKGPEGTPPPQADPPAPLEFNEAQQQRVDRIVAQRLARAKQAWEQEAQDAQRAAEQTLEARTTEEITKLRGEMTQRDQALSSTQRDLDIVFQLTEKNVQPKDLKRALKLAKLEDSNLEPLEVANRIVNDFPEFTRAAGRTGNDMGGGGPIQVTAEEFGQLDSMQRLAFKQQVGQAEFDRVQEAWLDSLRRARPKPTGYVAP